MRIRGTLAAGILLALLVGRISGQDAPVVYTFSTLAGMAGAVVNSADGTGSEAQFDAPRGIAVDRAGNAYVVDANNNTIRKITQEGVVTTLAGAPGERGRTDGAGAAARFSEPFGLAADAAGNLYVADNLNNAIRRITPDGVVTTFAGGGASGTTDGTGAAARFHEPRGVAVDADGTVYVADYENHTIRKITSAGVVTTLAGSPDTEGNADGTGAAARFRGPMGVAVDATGTVYVADSGNRSIRKITTAGAVTTLRLSGTPLSDPRGIVVDSTGTIYVGDFRSHTVRAITPTGTVSTLAGQTSKPGISDGAGAAAAFHYPSGVAIDTSGALYVADTENDTIRIVTRGGTVTTLAGLPDRTNSVDGTGADARFEDPFGTAVDLNGNVYVADGGAHTIRKVTPAGVVTTLAGSPGSFGSANGLGPAARFYSPYGVAVDGAGNVYVADSGNKTVRKISPEGLVTTLAGTALSGGSTDGTGPAARFDEPYGIAVDSAGNLYVSDASQNTIRKITPAGVVTTLAGTAGSPGSTDGTGAAARFAVPYGVAVDSTGNVYVVDHGNHTVRKVTPAGVVTTLAGTPGSIGSADGTGAAARFKFPGFPATDTRGNVFVIDTDNQAVRQITPAGVVTTVGGGTVGSTDGAGTAARFFDPKGIAADRDGRLYIADRRNHTIRLGTSLNASSQ